MKAAAKKKPKQKQKPKQKPKPKKPPMTAAAYAWATMDTTIGLPDGARNVDGRRIYVEYGRDVAVLALDGDELVVDFEPPRDTTEFAAVMRHYKPSPGRPNWLRYREPATRDPRPGLEANIGSMLGRARFDRRPPLPAFRSITSGGGPYVCVPASQVAAWHGDAYAGEFPEAAALYKKVRKAPDGASLVALPAGGRAIVLGTPDTLYWLARADGGLLVRVVSFDRDDDAHLEKLLAKVPATGWTAVAERLAVTEPLRAFDAATFGGALGKLDTLSLELARGTYELASRTWKPEPGTELLLSRLRR